MVYDGFMFFGCSVDGFVSLNNGFKRGILFGDGVEGHPMVLSFFKA